MKINLKDRITKNILALVVVNILIIIMLVIIYPPILKYKVLNSLLSRMSEINVVALGLTIVFISGGFDLSFPSVMAITGIICGKLFNGGFPFGLAVLISLTTGLVIGLINSFFIVKMKLNAFIITVAMDLIVRSFAYGISAAKTITGFPQSFLNIKKISILGFPSLFVFMLIIAVILALVMKKTIIGRRIFAVGGNEKAALITGIYVNRTKIFVYMLSGFLASVAGIMTTMRINSAPPNVGMNIGLEVVTAVVIGGTILTGGEGSILGTSLGVFAMFLLGIGFNTLGLNQYWKIIIIGLIMLLVIGYGKISQTIIKRILKRDIY